MAPLYSLNSPSPLPPAPLLLSSYVHSLKEATYDIPNQAAITRDNVTITIDGVLYVRIVDAKKASYGAGHATARRERRRLLCPPRS